MRKLTYIKQLQSLNPAPFFTAKDAEKKGVPRHALIYLEKRGDLERVYPGTYRFSEYEPKIEFQWENLGLIASSVADSVICLISALVYYDLTDQIMREIWLAVPHESYPPKRPNTRIIRMRNSNLGKTAIVLGEYYVHIFDRERCIVDAFRCLSKEIAIKALKKYLANTKIKPDLKKLALYAKKLRVNIAPYVLSCTT